MGKSRKQKFECKVLKVEQIFPLAEPYHILLRAGFINNVLFLFSSETTHHNSSSATCWYQELSVSELTVLELGRIEITQKLCLFFIFTA